MGVDYGDADFYRRSIFASFKGVACFHYGLLGSGSYGLACTQARNRVLFTSPRTIHFTTIAWHRCSSFPTKGLRHTSNYSLMTTSPAESPLACPSFLYAAPALGSRAASCECLYRHAFLWSFERSPSGRSWQCLGLVSPWRAQPFALLTAVCSARGLGCCLSH